MLFSTGLLVSVGAVLAAPVFQSGALEPLTEAVEIDAAPAKPPREEARQMSLLEQAHACLEAINNMQARFTQRAPSGAVSTGMFYLARPGRLRFEYDDPNPQLIVATGGLVYIHDAELETTDSYPVGQTPLRFLLASELDLNDAEIMAVEENDYGLRIDLAAKDQDLQGQLSLFFDPEPLVLSGWSFLDPRGNLTVIRLDDVVEKRRLSSNLFRVPDSGGTFLRDR